MFHIDPSINTAMQRQSDRVRAVRAYRAGFSTHGENEMNQNQMNTAAPNGRSKAVKLGAVALVMTLAMTLAPRAYADPAPLPFSRPQLGGEVAVQSVLRYIALHSNDVAGYQAVDPAVDSVARYLAVHAVSAQRGLSAEELAIDNYLHDHGIPMQRGRSAEEQAIDNYLHDHAVPVQSGRSAEEQALIDVLIARGVTFGR